MFNQKIFYLGNFLSEDIVLLRQLPTSNTAGSNRIKRISEAFNLSHQVIVYSPGFSARVKLNIKKLYLKRVSSRVKGVFYNFSPGIAIPFLGLLINYPLYFFDVIFNTITKKPKVIVIYNFDPINLLLTSVIRLFFTKIKLVNNIEDVSVPKFSDFNKKSEDRGVQQLIFFFCMRIIAKMSHAYIIPTKKFISFLPEKQNILVLTGCIKVNQNVSLVRNKINILFAGKIAFEHGIDIFIDAIEIINSKGFLNDFEIHISGGGEKSNWVENKLKMLNYDNVSFHGFTSNAFYKKLLDQSDICVALQNPKGRHSEFKTPSKVYEYMGNSKAVVATNVGDLKVVSDLGIIKLCNPLKASHLAEILISLKAKDLKKIKEKTAHFAFENYDYTSVNKQLNELIKNVS